MRYSLYYRNPFGSPKCEMDYHNRQNELRVAKASEFWSSNRQSISLDFTKKQKDADIDIMIVTTSRHNSLIKGKNTRFLTQVLWQFFSICCFENRVLLALLRSTMKARFNAVLSMTRIELEFRPTQIIYTG